MNEQMYDDFHLEQMVSTNFGQNLQIDSVIARHFPISRGGWASLFLTNKKQLFLYLDSEPKLTLADVRKVVSRIGLKPDIFIPPKGRPLYFDEIGTEKFQAIFPGRTHVTGDDIAFYRTLAPYSPALVLISEVKNGEIRQYDSDSNTGWRVTARFTYRRIKTS